MKKYFASLVSGSICPHKHLSRDAAKQCLHLRARSKSLPQCRVLEIKEHEAQWIVKDLLTEEEVPKLKVGDVLYHVKLKDSRKYPLAIRVNGKCRTWKRRPGYFELPTKHGLYEYHTILPEEIKDRIWGKEVVREW